MTVDRSAREVHYRHIRGITRGMDVVWSMVPGGSGVDVAVEHRWSGPGMAAGGRRDRDAR